MQSNQFALFKTRRFLPLFITQFLGAFNDNVFKNAFVILITYRLADRIGMNSQLLVTLVAGIFILPFFLFSATGGQLADKYEKSRLIAMVKFVEIILMCLAVLGFYWQSVTFLMLILFLIGTQATFFGPLKYAILPEQIHENELIAGNGLIEAGTFLAILVGTMLGGLFILYPSGEFFISVVLITLAVGGWISSLMIPPTQLHDSHLKINFNFVTETVKLIQYSTSKWDIFLCVLGISWFWVVGFVLISEFPVFTKDILHANEHVVTFFFACFSIGIAMGSLLCNRILKGRVHATYVPLGALGMAIFTIDLFFATHHLGGGLNTELLGLISFLQSFQGWRVTIDILLIAISGGIFTVPLYAILQQRSEKTHRARVIASNNVLNALFMVFAAALTFLMLALGFSLSTIFLMVGISTGIVAIYICKLLPDIILRTFFRSVFQALYRVKVNGLENYYNAGERVVIIANHVSFLDAILLATYLPDKLTFAVNTFTAKKWWIKLFLRLVDAYQIDPTNPFAIKSLIEFVRLDKRCVIFPEGRLTVTGALMKMYEGPGLIADKSKAKLLPIRIQGAEYTPFSRLKGKIHTRWMPQITLTIFPAQMLGIYADIKGRKRRQQIGLKLYDILTEVMFESSPYHQTLFSSLIDAHFTQGRRLEIVEDIAREPTSYQQFLTRCFILGGMIAKVTQPGENVGILLPNMISTAITFFGLHAFSRVPAMLNFSAGVRNNIIACQTAKIKRVYTSSQFVNHAKLQDVVIELRKIGVTVIYLEDMRSSVRMIDKLKGVLRAQCPRLAYKLANNSGAARQMCHPEAPAVVLFTSGSEGTPKGVVLSHKNIQANRYQMSACIDFNTNDKVFNAMPVFHSFGLTGGMLLPLLSGVKVFLYPSPLHYRIIPELSYDTNATILFGTDTFLSGYAKYAHQYDFYSVRYVFAGAEKLRDETKITWLQKFGVRLFEGYGATETSPVLAFNTPMQNKAGTVGRLLPAIRYQLNSVPGITTGGTLSVSGPNVMLGYLLVSQPGVLVPPPQGWYDTGDVVEIDETGYVTIKGRVKRFAKIAGEMVSLAMVEEQMYLLWPAYQHAAIAMPDPKKGELIVLVTTNPSATREEIVSFAKKNFLSDMAIPRKIHIIKEMPLLGTGKVDYPRVKDIMMDDSGIPA